MKRFTMLSLALALTPWLLACPAAAQETARSRAAEVAELEALLAKVDAAIARTAPLLEVELVQYDVRHLLWRPADRAAPRLSSPTEAAGDPSGAEGKFTFDDEEAEDGAFDRDQLELLVSGAVGGDEAWADLRGLERDHGYLLVWQTRANHARIARLLAQLAAKQTRAVQLEVQLYALPPELQAQLEQTAAARDGVLDAEALAQLDEAVAEDPKRLAGSALLTALDQQRVFVHQGAQRAYLAGHERRSVGTAEVDDPLVEVLVTGTVLEVQPSILDGEPAEVALDVHFDRTRSTGLTQRSTPWGPTDTPTAAADAAHTAARVPDGAGMLVFSTHGSPAVTIIVRPRIVRP